jgi:glycosyltransferase involved in cell wall biosynthesis
MRKQIKTIHGCDLDGVFPAIIFKLITQKKTTIIFDIFDWFSDTLSNQSFLIRIIFNFMEKLSIKYSDEIIICEKERINQIPYKLKKDVKVLQNIPSFNSIDFLYKEEKYLFNNTKKTISYVGGFYKERFIDELIQIAEDGYINLNIAGYGDKEIENRCLLISELPNVKYYGKVDYKVGLNIMYNSDLIFAIYSTTNKNHIFAAPNKYYEAMMLGKPIISNSGTILSAKIFENRTGFVIEESIDDLKKLITILTNEDINELSHNAKTLWINIFENKVDVFLKTVYSNIIN